MELLSLSLMTAIYLLHKRKYPIYYYFGLADTVVVSSLALTAKGLDLIDGSYQITYLQLSHSFLDSVFVPIHMIICGIAISTIIRQYRQSKLLTHP